MPSFQDNGLRFECTRCGECCRRKAGALFLSASDLRRIAESLGITDEEFFLEYCEVIDLRLAKRVSLVAEENGDCVFWGEDGCQIYEQRPTQCRTYPFWATNLVDLRTWRRAGKTCPGIHQGRLWSPREIREVLASSEQEPLLDVSHDD